MGDMSTKPDSIDISAPTCPQCERVRADLARAVELLKAAYDALPFGDPDRPAIFEFLSELSERGRKK